MTDSVSKTPLILCREICKQYGSGDAAVHALRGISIEIERGENIAVMGPSGSGKSTLLQIVGCLDLPTAGAYLLNDCDVTVLDDDALSELRGKTIGFVFQAFHFFPRMNLLENVSMPLYYQGATREERLDRARTALEMVRLGHRADHLPHKLSGGERQRGAIARAIVHSPSMILADEPTGNLDSSVKEEILGHLVGLNKQLGVTIITVTHDEETAAKAHRVIYVRDGLISKEERR